MKKSYKREIACALLSFWGIASISMFWFMDAERAAALHDPYFAMTYSILGFAAAAFGMHSLATQFGDK